ncbi:MAG TPA: tetratricopeptide repeat protein, partial [Gemmataceae bacterium]|nr:tetratricopeptide repeat protein [Gemmataceae bacterium]
AIREPDPSAVSSLTTPEMSKPDDATRRQLAELLASQQRLDEALQTVSTKLNAEKMEDVVPALDGLITARQKAEEDHRQAEKKWRQAQGDLNQANQTLEALRKSGLEEVKVTQARLDEAVNREKEARQMIAELVAARKEADESFRSVAEKLRSAKILGEKTDRQSVLKSIDDLIGREDLNAKAEIAHLRRTLERSRSPGQMLDFWPVMLEHNTPADLAAAALADADAVFTDPQTPEDSKAKALAVKALALLAQEDFTAARVVLGQAGRTTALNGDAGWTARLKKANAELSDSTALREQVRRYLAHGHPSEALAAADRGLKIFPKSAYRKDYHRVLGLRAECLLQLNRLDEAEKDATVALETGLTADGHFTLGRVAERRRQWAVAKEHLSRAFAEAKQPEQVKPIRIALARVLSGPEAGDSDLAQASQLADQAIAAGQPEAYLVKSRVFQRQKKFSEALEASLLALKALAPEEYGDNWAALVREHPGLREDLVLSIAKADPVAAERLFGTGMRLYFAHQFSAAETQLLEAIKNNPNDARYYYFLGLSRVPQGKTDEAEKVLWRAVALERQGMPDTDAVNTYLERVQGPERNWINRVRRP